MSVSDTEIVAKSSHDSQMKSKLSKPKLSIKIPRFLRWKHHHHHDGEEHCTCQEEDTDHSSDDSEECDAKDVRVKVSNEIRRNPLGSDAIAIPTNSSGPHSAPASHNPIWPMTPPDHLHSCLRFKRSMTISEGEDLQSKVCASQCHHVSFSPDTVDPLPRSCSYRKYIESKRCVPNLKHEKHKQKMCQLKKVNITEFLSSGYQRSPLSFTTMPCDMMF